MSERRSPRRTARSAAASKAIRLARRSPPREAFVRAGSLPVSLALAALVSVSPGPATADGEPDRGAALYENHCGDCHGEALHRREASRVRSRDELHGWVAAWSAHAGLPWGEEEIESVTRYLSREVYGFTR